MRCLSGLLLATTASADEYLFEDSAVQLLQLKANIKEKEEAEARLHASSEEFDVMQNRPNTKSTEATSMQNAECAIWGRVFLTKTFYGFTDRSGFGAGFNDVMAIQGWLWVKDSNGADKTVMDIKNNGVYSMAESKDGRFKAQTYTSGPSNNANEIHAVAFEVDGTVIRVIQPEVETMQRCTVPSKSGCTVWPYDDNALGNTWANHKMRIRVGGNVYSQFDLPVTIPGTNIELTQHKWNNHLGTLQSGLIIDNKDGFWARVEQVSSNGNGLWMNVNIKFTPDNLPDRYQDSFCGRGPEATPVGDPEGKGVDIDWESSLFTADDHHDVCYADYRYYGGVNVPGDPPFCPRLGDTEWVGGDRMHKLWRGGWGEPVGYGPGGTGQCNQSPEVAEEAWKRIESYAKNMIVNWKYGICSAVPPKPEPTPTTQELCALSGDKKGGFPACDHSRGEEICEPVKGSEGEGDGAMYHDCLFAFCAECQEEAAQEFLGEVDEDFPTENFPENDDTAAAVGDPHLSPAGGRKFDLEPDMLKASPR